VTGFLLIAGAGHGGWCWELVAPLLQRQGHSARALDLPGMGGDPTPHADITLDLWARAAAGAARQLPAPRIIVAHSRGGVVASQAAERLGQDLAGVVYLAALLVPDGLSGFDVAAWSGAPPIPALIAPDGASFSLDREVARARLYDATPPNLASRALDRIEAEPLAPLSQKLALTGRRYGRVARAFIACARDNSTIDAKLRREMLKRSPCQMVRVIDADHSPFYSAPEALVEAILAAPFRG
jgi:pimeloyl-ACP methyl ester carboxylesterase